MSGQSANPIFNRPIPGQRYPLRWRVLHIKPSLIISACAKSAHAVVWCHWDNDSLTHRLCTDGSDRKCELHAKPRRLYGYMPAWYFLGRLPANALELSDNFSLADGVPLSASWRFGVLELPESACDLLNVNDFGDVWFLHREDACKNGRVLYRRVRTADGSRIGRDDLHAKGALKDFSLDSWLEFFFHGELIHDESD